MSRLATDTSEDNMKSYLATKVPLVNLKCVSIFTSAPSQDRAISSVKVIVSAENMPILLNKALWPIGSLIKEVIPDGRLIR